MLNPRVRNRKIFNELVTSIAHLGLKKPITVSARPDQSGYDLVCGQERLEAFGALGQTEIPAVVLQESQEDCFVMSLVENLARRHHSPIELMREIGELRKRGYSTSQIAAKTDFSDEYVNAICYLLDNGEERLLSAIERGVMPTTVAMEIVRAKDTEIQEALAEAYEKKTIPGNQILAPSDHQLQPLRWQAAAHYVARSQKWSLLTRWFGPTVRRLTARSCSS